MFAKSAAFYDAIYAWKDYAAESARLHAIVQERTAGRATTLLDVACGTGQHLAHLQQWYAVEGLDLDDGLLAVARARLPDVPLQRADMVDFDLGRRFDAVTCLFSAIGYVQTVERLDQAVAAMARHLAPGGVLVVEPWLLPEAFVPGRLHALFVDQPELKVARLDESRVEGRLSILDFHYLVGTPAGIEHFTERHTVGLFADAEYVAAFEKAGLAVERDPVGLMGRGLYVGVRGG